MISFFLVAVIGSIDFYVRKDALSISKTPCRGRFGNSLDLTQVIKLVIHFVLIISRLSTCNFKERSTTSFIFIGIYLSETLAKHSG
jgi:hypothetical protein